MTNNKSYNDFFKEIESIFNIEKLTDDFFKHNNPENSQAFFVSSVHELNGNIKTHEVKKDDTISLSDICIVKKYYKQIFLPFQVNIIVGDFESDLGIILIEKFRVEMLYDFDYELITFDLIHNVES